MRRAVRLAATTWCSCVAFGMLFLSGSTYAQELNAVAHKFLKRHGVPCLLVLKVGSPRDMGEVATCQDGREWALFWLEDEIAYVQPQTREVLQVGSPDLPVTPGNICGAENKQRRPPFIRLRSIASETSTVDARELVETADLRFMPRRSIISSADRRLAAARAGSDPLGRKVDHRRLQAHREPFEMTLPELLHERGKSLAVHAELPTLRTAVGCCLKKQAEP